jgi:hypothetical protein
MHRYRTILAISNSLFIKLNVCYLYQRKRKQRRNCFFFSTNFFVKKSRSQGMKELGSIRAFLIAKKTFPDDAMYRTVPI